MSKFGPKVYAADSIKTKGNFLVGTIWEQLPLMVKVPIILK